MNSFSDSNDMIIDYCSLVSCCILFFVSQRTQSRRDASIPHPLALFQSRKRGAYALGYPGSSSRTLQRDICDRFGCSVRHHAGARDASGKSMDPNSVITRSFSCCAQLGWLPRKIRFRGVSSRRPPCFSATRLIFSANTSISCFR